MENQVLRYLPFVSSLNNSLLILVLLEFEPSPPDFNLKHLRAHLNNELVLRDIITPRHSQPEAYALLNLSDKILVIENS
jgi:hypothetical protein